MSFAFMLLAALPEQTVELTPQRIRVLQRDSVKYCEALCVQRRSKICPTEEVTDFPRHMEFSILTPAPP